MEETLIPHELYSIRQQLGFDDGKFGYVLRDGKIVPYDVSRTPIHMFLETNRLAQKVERHLAEGIWSITDGQVQFPPKWSIAGFIRF
jgi:hypothetical protein